MDNNFQLLKDLRKSTNMPSRELLEYGHYGYTWMSGNSKTIIASHTVYEMLDMEPFSEFLTIESWRQLVHSQDLYKLLQAEETLLAFGLPVTVEYRMITKKNRIIFISHFMQVSSGDENGRKILSMLDEITEQKRGDVILEAMDEGFFELDKHLAFRRINAKAEFFFGVERDSLMQMPFLEVFPQAEDTAFYHLITTARKERRNQVQEVLWPVNNHWLHVSASPYSDGVIIMFYDIQNEKAAEERLRQSESKYHSLVDHTPDAISRWNKGLRLVFANTAFETKLGISQTNLYGKTRSEMGQPDDIASSWSESLQKVFTTGKEVEHFHSFPTAKGESHFYSRLVPEKNEEGEIETVLSIGRDITELKNAEQHLKESKELLQSVFNAGLIGMSVLKAVRDEAGAIKDFRIQLVNAHVEKNTGRTDLVGKLYAEEYPGVRETGLFDFMIKVMETGISDQLDYHYNKDGFDRWLSTMFLKLEDGLVATTLDITERKQGEEKIIELNKILKAKNRELQSANSELTTFNAIAANDYKETLKQLYTNLEFIISTEAHNLTNAGKANIRRTQTGIQKMKLLTDDIIALSKIKSPDNLLSTINLNEVFKTVLTDLDEKIAEAEALTDSDTLPEIEGYPLLLSLLFYHLTDNSIKFRQKENVLFIRIRYKKIPGLELEGALPGIEYHSVSFIDNGIGFPQSESSNLFNVFYRLHYKGIYKGSGIGLSICKKIMDVHNGFIIAESNPGNGARFTCFFPAEK